MKEKNKHRLGVLGLLTIAIIWGSGFAITKFGLETFGPMTFLAIRFGVAWIIMTGIFWPHLHKLRPIEVQGILVTGLLLFSGFAIQTYGLQYTTAGKQAFITGTGVVMVPFIAWAVLKTPPKLRAVVAAIVCFAGIALLSLDGNLKMSYGDALTLFSAVFYAGQIVALGYYVQHVRLPVLLVGEIFVTALLTFLLAFFTETFPQTVPAMAWVSVLFTAVACTCICFFIQTWAQRYVNPTTAAIVMSTESVHGSLFSVLIFHEVFTTKMVIGSAAILIAAIIAEWQSA